MPNEVVSIVAGGWSVAFVNAAKIPGTIIGVNDSFFRLPKCDIGITMDRLFAENRFEKMRIIAKPFHIRSAALKNIHMRPPWINSFDCDHLSNEFSDKSGILNGTNSGLCAFNLAYQMKPKKIFLFGFDMGRSKTGQKHWYPPYEWTPVGKEGTSNGKYTEWAKQFDRVAHICNSQNIDVTNVSDSPSIKSFRRLSTKGFNNTQGLAA